MTEFGVIDYRKDGHVLVEEGDNNTFTVTLKFFFRVTDGSRISESAKQTICENWCAKWGLDEVRRDFENLYRVFDAKWLEPTVFQMNIEKPTNHRDEEYTLQYMHEWFRHDSLEDGFYEGEVDETFWRVPQAMN